MDIDGVGNANGKEYDANLLRTLTLCLRYLGND